MIIGITGLAGAGKDTVADLLVKGHGFVKVSLADPMKRFCKEVFGFTVEQLWGPSELRNAPDLRYVRVPAHDEPLFYKGPDELNFNARAGTAYVPDESLTPRFALQRLGTEWGRACYEDVWIDYAVRVAGEMRENPFAKYDSVKGLTYRTTAYKAAAGDVIIPDVRFRNEFEAIRKAGGRVLKITRPGAGLEGAAGAHVSETESAGWKDQEFDHVIRNDGTLGDLEASVHEFLYQLEKSA